MGEVKTFGTFTISVRLTEDYLGFSMPHLGFHPSRPDYRLEASLTVIPNSAVSHMAPVVKDWHVQYDALHDVYLAHPEMVVRNLIDQLMEPVVTQLLQELKDGHQQAVAQNDMRGP